ncbi:MAG: M4 family metallopeptidase, partial [Halobacteriales archaeon]|nr:M4 family metallopeptidase [Halobacteriales archaeon]
SRLSGVALLDDLSTEPVQLVWDGDIPTIYDMNVPTSGDNPVERGFNFLDQAGELLSIPDPRATFAPSKVKKDNFDDDILHYRQHFEGFPVQGARLVVELVDGNATSFSGNYITEAPELPETTVSLEEAEQLALTAIGVPAAYVGGDTRRIIFDEHLFEPHLESNPRFVWRVSAVAMTDQVHGEWQVLVDVETGQILDRVNQTHTVDIEVFDANGEYSDNSCYVFDGDSDSVCTEAGCERIAPPDARSAQSFSHVLHDFHANRNGHISYDDNDSQIESFVEVEFPDDPNASWSGWCELMRYSPGYVTIDIFAHEFGHAVSDGTGAEIKYRGEAGAIEEGLADTWAAIVQGHEEGTDFDHLIGEGVFGPRDMSNPPEGNDPDHVRDYCDCGSAEWERVESVSEPTDPAYELCFQAEAGVWSCIRCNPTPCNITRPD